MRLVPFVSIRSCGDVVCHSSIGYCFESAIQPHICSTTLFFWPEDYTVHWWFQIVIYVIFVFELLSNSQHIPPKLGELRSQSFPLIVEGGNIK